jgi:homoserine kinase
MVDGRQMIAHASLAAARVRVPGSTSNLGAGFDCVGLALNRYLVVEFEPGSEPLRLERAGTLALVTHPPADDLLVRVFRARLAELGIAAPTGTLRAESEIPVARGLGSSAAAVVAALCVAEAAAGGAMPRSAMPGGDRVHLLLMRAAGWESHLDNVAPSVCGGLVGVVREGDGVPRVMPLSLSAEVGFAYAAPALEIATARARSALPETVLHTRASQALGRLTALLHGLATGDPDLLRIGFTDELHVPFRLPLIPRAGAARTEALREGAWAVTISGGGSGLIAVCPRGRERAVAGAMAAVFAGGPGAPAVAIDALPDTAGARREQVVACR